jgi:predicted secreted protein with PEFG-CTERM motif
MQNLNGLYVVLTLVLGFTFLGLHHVSATSSNESPVINSQVSDVSNSVLVDDSNFSVHYDINNGQVLSVQGNNQSRSVIIHTKTTGDGILTVTLPRGLIDSKINGKDDKFFVSVDGQDESFDEIKTTDNDRTLSIPFSVGVQEIEIMGIKAVPEFGIVTSLALAIATLTVIVFATKTRKIFS